MNDDYDNAKDDKTMLAKATQNLEEVEEEYLRTGREMPARAARKLAEIRTGQLCRYCWRRIFLSYNQVLDQARWILEYREYEDTSVCDMRGDGASLSTLPHEPNQTTGVPLDKLIELAAATVSEPGTFRDTDEAHDLALVRLITEAAGLTIGDEDYVYAAIIRAAYETRGKEFQRAAYRYQALEPWGRYWHAHRPTRRNS